MLSIAIKVKNSSTEYLLAQSIDEVPLSLDTLTCLENGIRDFLYTNIRRSAWNVAKSDIHEKVIEALEPREVRTLDFLCVERELTLVVKKTD